MKSQSLMILPSLQKGVQKVLKTLKNNKPFTYFSIAALLLLLRAKIALAVRSMFVEDYYWDAVYHTDMVVIATAMWGICSAIKTRWQRVVIECYTGFVIGDIIDRIFFYNTIVTKWDIIAIGLAILIPTIKYLIKWRKRHK